jgi:beta-glucanase (GH16 family)
VEPPSPWVLTWSDDFEGAAGTPPDATRWGFDLGTGPNQDGWGNGELQSYTSDAANIQQDGQGHLVITARRQAVGNRSYSSARIKTQGLFAQQYGRIEARIKLPAGKGLWPAFWMLGANIDQVDPATKKPFGWPTCGEIDILELRGNEPSKVVASLHGPQYFGAGAISKTYTLPPAVTADGGTTPTSFDQDFHVFAVEWDPGRIDFLVDEVRFQSVSAHNNVSPPARTWVYHHPFFLILNLAVGGSFLKSTGQPDPNAPFPDAVMTVDSVKVYRRAP